MRSNRAQAGFDSTRIASSLEFESTGATRVAAIPREQRRWGGAMAPS